MLELDRFETVLENLGPLSVADYSIDQEDQYHVGAHGTSSAVEDSMHNQ